MTRRHARRSMIAPCVLLTLALTACGGLVAKSPSGTSTAKAASSRAKTTSDPDLIWRDDFTGPAARAPSSAQWGYDLGGGGWGHHELQSYTSSVANAGLDGTGQLKIEALKSPTNTFTSARLTTRGKVPFGTGTLSVSMKMPAGKGILAKFALVSDATSPTSGLPTAEVDVAQVSSDAHKVFTTLQGPKISEPSQQWQVGTSFVQATPVDAAFHVYAVQKTAGQLAFAIDGKITAIVKSADLPAGDSWAFDQPMAIVLSVSVGGDVLGPPDTTTPFPAALVLDWISLSRKVTS